MTHLIRITRMPGKAVDLPANHTWEFIKGHLPNSFVDLVRLISLHVKGCDGGGNNA